MEFLKLPQLSLPDFPLPIVEIPHHAVRLFIKREDLIHPEISGNKYWKLFYNIKNYLQSQPGKPRLITFGGAYSNHIAAVAALGKDLAIPTVGIIRGEELHAKIADNFTLKKAAQKGMEFHFVSREAYRDKISLEKDFKAQYPDALIIPEGGSNALAVKGLQHVLNEETKEFNYICAAVGTGGTVAGLSKYAETNQKVLGFKVVNDPTLSQQISALGGRSNVELYEAHDGSYGKITEETVRFINRFYQEYKIPLDPVYTGKLLKKLWQLIEEGHFEEEHKILIIHTGGLQGIEGANEMLKRKNRTIINFRE